jgi:ABC-2 type transport system permease protein
LGNGRSGFTGDPPLEQDQQQFWEYLNYGLALMLIAAIALVQRLLQRRRLQRLHTLIAAQ